QMRNAIPVSCRVPPERIVDHQLTERRETIRGGGRQSFHRGVLARYRAMPHLFRTPDPVSGRACCITPVPGNETTGAAMDGSAYYRKAEELAAKAAEYLG